MKVQLGEDVRNARVAGRPVLALESTIISHGMPYPENVQTALRVEEIARDNGAVPATVAIIRGQLTVGLTADEIDALGRAGTAVVKTSRRDLPVLTATGRDGATTVAATMIAADLAGIRVFATGGIGGVHRGAEVSFDISADLEELGRTPVAVVCAGVKSILDIGLTLEYLETKGVPVLGYKTTEMPAFYTSKSGFSVDHRVDSPDEAASIMDAQWSMGLGGGLVVANPISESLGMPRDIIDDAIRKALTEMNDRNLRGKESTPFLLARVAELTGGDSLRSNIALVESNVALGARIAVAYSRRQSAPT